MATHIVIDGAAAPRAAHPKRGADSGAEDGAFASLLGHSGAQDHRTGKPGGDSGQGTAGAPAQHSNTGTPRKGEDAAPGQNAHGVLPGQHTDGARAHGEPQQASRYPAQRPDPGANAAQRLAQLAGRIENAAGLQTAQARVAAIAVQQAQATAGNRQAGAHAAGQQTTLSSAEHIPSGAGAERAGHARAGAEAGNGRFAGHHIALTMSASAMKGQPASPISGENALAAVAAGQNGAGRAAAESALARGAGQKTESRGQQHGEADATLLRQGARDHATTEGRPELRNAIIEKLGEQSAQNGRLQSPDSREAGTQQLPQGANTAASAGVNQSEAAGRHANAAPSPLPPGGDPVAQSSSTQSPQSQNVDPLLQVTSGSGSGTPDAEAASRPANPQPQGRPVPAHVVHEQVAVQIQRAAADGQQRMTIRLHPAELGRIEVKLDLAADGSVRALLAVDRPETLDLMQRDVRGLEKALNDAGLKTDNGSLSFDLRGEGGGDEQPGRDNAPDEATLLSLQEAGPEDARGDGSAPAQPRRLVSADGIDIRI